MGTHPSNPSHDLATSRSLLDLVQENQMLLSPSIAKRFEQRLPFLFKVLSINKALSIQAHPNKKLAEQIHAKDSKNYPDDNHKPEMTIAITPFEGLCGFRPLEQICHFLRTVPSLRELVGDDESQAFEEALEGHGASEEGKKKALRHAFTSLMQSTPEEIEREAPLLIKQAKDEGSKFAGDGGEANDGEELADLIIRLNGQFPNDIGLFVFFFLNYVQLQPGEAMFLKADDIHAYLSGGSSSSISLPH
jgi:mannose-6-phosphate isomerase